MIGMVIFDTSVKEIAEASPSSGYRHRLPARGAKVGG